MVRSMRYADCLAPALTTALHLLFVFLLFPYADYLYDYLSPVFPLYWTLFFCTVCSLNWVATRDPGFVQISNAKDTTTHNISYKNTCDKTAGMMEVQVQGAKKPKNREFEGNAEGGYLPSKEGSRKGTENYKYYEFSEPTPVNLHTEEDSRIAEEDRAQEGLGNVGSQLHSLNDVPNLQKSEHIPTDKDKAELDTSEVRENGRNHDPEYASSSLELPPIPITDAAKSKFEDMDLSLGQTIVTEIRYCVVCKTEQPLRAKHCKDCGVCVTLHDHHCPWLGVCIGEKTRCYFYGYLCLEVTLLWSTLLLVGLRQAVVAFQSEPTVLQWLKRNGLLLGVTVVVGFFTLMVSCLLGFHTYLAACNLTTCTLHPGEVASWSRISYLKQWPRAYGSPFSKGLLSNLYFYCCRRVPKPFNTWSLPKTLPAAPASLCC